MSGVERRVSIIQGECKISSDPDVVFSTILGSCVAACSRDPVAGVGGMNHFLLPGDDLGAGASDAECYGVYLMELLVNGLMKEGALRQRLEAKVFGGARMLTGLSDIGRKNADFATRFCEYEGIAVLGSDLGGEQARRVHFWPVSGRARLSYVTARVERVDARERVAPRASSAGDVELFA